MIVPLFPDLYNSFFSQNKPMPQLFKECNLEIYMLPSSYTLVCQKPRACFLLPICGNASVHAFGFSKKGIYSFNERKE